MSALYDIMLELSRGLSDEHIDEQRDEIEIRRGRSGGTVENHVVHVRGKLNGVPVVVSDHRYFSQSFGAYPVYQREILELFVAGPHLSFEGECRRRTPLDAVGRWFGRGGLRGPHAVFESRRIDGPAPVDLSDFERPAFAGQLERLSGDLACVKIQLQARTGINAIFQAVPFRGSAQAVATLLRQCAALASA